MTEHIPEVSVILTTCDRPDSLALAVGSVLTQTYSDFELLIVDDGSVDDPAHVLEGICDERVRFLVNEKRLGAPRSRNRGIEASRGRFVAFLDDDDEWMPEKLEKQVLKIRSCPENTGVVYTGAEIVSSGQVRRSPASKKGDLRDDLMVGSTIGSVSKVIARRECFIKAGYFDAGLASGQDWDMWKRIADHYEFDVVPDILVRIHAGTSGRISTSLDNLIRGREAILAKYMDEFRVRPEVLVTHYKRLGKLHCINGTWGRGVSFFREAVKLRPREAVKILAWIVLELPLLRVLSPYRGYGRYLEKEGA